MNNKNYAFASDYARFRILYKYGGLYVDTDVEFIKRIDDLIKKGSFMGTEKHVHRIGTGLIMYFDKPNHICLKNLIDIYENTTKDILSDGDNMGYVLKSLYGYKWIDITQELGDNITVYSSKYFCPPPIVQETRTIHHYTRFWKNKD